MLQVFASLFSKARSLLLKKKFIYLINLGCAGFSLLRGLCSSRQAGGGYALVAMHVLFITVASLVEHGLQGAWVQ